MDLRVYFILQEKKVRKTLGKNEKNWYKRKNRITTEKIRYGKVFNM